MTLNFKKQCLYIITFTIISLIMLANSCANNKNWYPEGTVEVVDYRVYDENATRKCTIFYKTSNTGLSVISITTISFKVITDGGEYYKTIVDETIIHPEK